MYTVQKQNFEEEKRLIEWKLEKLEQKEKHFWERENDEDVEIDIACRRIDIELDNCMSTNSVLVQLLEERRELLEKIKREKAFFFEEAERWFEEKKNVLILEGEKMEYQIKNVELGEE